MYRVKKNKKPKKKFLRPTKLCSFTQKAQKKKQKKKNKKMQNKCKQHKKA